MSNLQAAITVADQIVARLFDQRQFTSGEIYYLAKELGGKVNFEESLDRVLKLNENVCLISDTSDTNLANTDADLAKDISQKVTNLNELTEKLLKIEEKYKTDKK